MRIGLAAIAGLLLATLIACSTPTPAAPTPVPITVPPATLPPPTPTPLGQAVGAITTPLVVLNILTPTPVPTSAPTAVVTVTLVATPTLGAAGGAAQPNTPSELGSSAGDAALVAVLRSCWGVGDPRQLNGANAAQRDAFNCARASLLAITQNYPAYALVYRVLAWGYYYKDQDTGKAVSAYRTSATLYHQAGDSVGESEARMRLGLLLMAANKGQGCGELASASSLDAQNDRAVQYYTAYACGSVSNQTSGGQSVGPPALQVNLDQVRGKIVFKSGRDGGESYYVMNPDGSNQKRVTGAVYNSAEQWEAWSPDRSEVATVRYEGFTKKFGYNNDIWITDPSGGSGRPLTNPADDYDPAWSSGSLFDGQSWIAFVSNRGDIAHGLLQGEEIWLMHHDGTNAMRITCYGSATKHPSWSPDSSQLIFGSNFQTSSDRRQIYIISLAGLDTASDKCAVGQSFKNLSNNNYDDYEPIWVK